MHVNLSVMGHWTCVAVRVGSASPQDVYYYDALWTKESQELSMPAHQITKMLAALCSGWAKCPIILKGQQK